MSPVRAGGPARSPARLPEKRLQFCETNDVKGCERPAASSRSHCLWRHSCSRDATQPATPPSASPRAGPSTPPPWARSGRPPPLPPRSEEHTSELQSLMRTSYAVFCLKKKKQEQHE